MLTVPLGRWGFYLFAASLGIACIGSDTRGQPVHRLRACPGLRLALGREPGPREASRFALSYTIVIAGAAVPTLLGLDPLKLTILSMALTALILPPVIVPFVILMNDERYLGRHRNGLVSNVVVLAIIALAFVLAVVSIPLQILGG